MGNRFTIYGVTVRENLLAGNGIEYEKYLEAINSENEVMRFPILETREGMRICDLQAGTELAFVYGKLEAITKMGEGENENSQYGIRVYSFLTKREECYLETSNEIFI